MNINNNNTTKVLITSSIVFSLIIGFTSMTLAYGQEQPKYEKFEMTADLMERYISNTANKMFTFECPNDSDQTFTVWLGNKWLSIDGFGLKALIL